MSDQYHPEEFRQLKFDDREILDKMTIIKDFNEISESLLNKNLLRVLSN